MAVSDVPILVQGPVLSQMLLAWLTPLDHILACSKLGSLCMIDDEQRLANDLTGIVFPNPPPQTLLPKASPSMRC